jgi:hypothetical protein
VAAPTALFAAGNAMGVDVLVQVPDSKEASPANQNRRYFASTDHPVNRSQRDSQVIRSLPISHQRRHDCTRYFLTFHAAKIAGLFRTDFLEIAAACEPLCTFLRFRDPANHAKIVTNAVK